MEKLDVLIFDEISMIQVDMLDWLEGASRALLGLMHPRANRW